LLGLIAVALLSGANSRRALARCGQHAGWPRLRRLGFVRRGGPSRATLNRLLQSVEVAALEAVPSTWEQEVRAAWHRSVMGWLDGIAVDGTTLARRLGAAEAHLVSAFCQQRGLSLGQVAVADPTNELGAITPLLEQFGAGRRDGHLRRPVDPDHRVLLRLSGQAGAEGA
jgi:hypothetical protein